MIMSTDGTTDVLVGSYYYYNKSSSFVVFVKYHLMFSVDNDSTVACSLLFLNSYKTSHHLYNLNEEFFLDVKSTLYEISGFVQLEQDSQCFIQFFTAHFLESLWPVERNELDIFTYRYWSYDYVPLI